MPLLAGCAAPGRSGSSRRTRRASATAASRRRSRGCTGVIPFATLAGATAGPVASDRTVTTILEDWRHDSAAPADPRLPRARPGGLLRATGRAPSRRHRAPRRRCSSTASAATTRPSRTTSREAQALLRPGAPARVRLQPRRGRARVPRGDPPRPECAMCYWGVALDPRARTTTARPIPSGRRPRSRPSSGPWRWPAASRPRERATIEALAKRHAVTPPAATARRSTARTPTRCATCRSASPTTSTPPTLFADALMNLRPWDLWKPDGSMQPETPEILATLERVMRAQSRSSGRDPPLHPRRRGRRPTRAAARSPPTGSGRSCPGAGHLVHMPSHIYWRIGRYADAVDVNVARGQGRPRVHRPSASRARIYRGLYYPHNIDFIWQRPACRGGAPTRSGRRASSPRPRPRTCCARCRTWRPRADGPALRAGALRPVGGDPAPAGARRRSSRTSTGCWHYARGLAFAATGRRAEAEGELAALAASPRGAGRPVARVLLQDAGDPRPRGQRARRGDRRAVGPDATWPSAHLLAAVAEQDGHWFTEPPPWYFPVRQSPRRGPPRRRARRSRPRRSTATTSSATPTTGGRSSGSPRASRPRARRPRPPRSRRASRRPGPAPT